jgi:hypothetical protein
MATKSLIIFVLLTLSAGFAGCGGGSDAATLTKKQFIKLADAICEKSEGEQLQLVGEYAKKHPGAEEEDFIIPAALPPLEKEIEKIKTLPAPSGDEAQIDAILNAFEAAIAHGKEVPRDLLVDETDPFAKPDKLANSYGFKTCSHAP